MYSLKKCLEPQMMDTLIFFLLELFKILIVTLHLNECIDANDTDYYIAKFNTKYNLTEWYRHSNENGLNESVRGLVYDSEQQICLMAVEIKGNKYLNSTVSDTRYGVAAYTN